MMAEKATDLGGEQNVITNFTVLWIFAVVDIFVVLSCFIFYMSRSCFTLGPWVSVTQSRIWEYVYGFYLV